MTIGDFHGNAVVAAGAVICRRRSDWEALPGYGCNFGVGRRIEGLSRQNKNERLSAWSNRNYLLHEAVIAKTSTWSWAQTVEDSDQVFVYAAVRRSVE